MSPGRQIALFIVFLTSHLTLSQFLYQNWTVLLALLLLVAWIRTRKENNFSASLIWALLIHLKIYMGILLLPLFLSGKGRTARLAILWTILLALIVLPFIGSSPFLAYGKALASAGSGMTSFFNQVSIPATILRFSQPPREWVRPEGPVDAPLLASLFYLGLPALFLILLLWKTDLDHRLGATLIYVLLFVPHVWDHMMLLLLLLLPFLQWGFFLALSILFALTYFYDTVVHQLLYMILVENLPLLSLRSFLLFFPFLTVLTLGGLLKSRLSFPIK